jgi:hypothetical protein
MSLSTVDSVIPYIVSLALNMNSAEYQSITNY